MADIREVRDDRFDRVPIKKDLRNMWPDAPDAFDLGEATTSKLDEEMLPSPLRRWPMRKRPREKTLNRATLWVFAMVMISRSVYRSRWLRRAQSSGDDATGDRESEEPQREE